LKKKQQQKTLRKQELYHPELNICRIGRTSLIVLNFTSQRVNSHSGK